MNDQDKIAYQAEIDRLNETIKWYQGQAGQRIGEAARAEIVGAPASAQSELRSWLSNLEDEALTDTGPQVFTKVRSYLQASGALKSAPAAPLPELTGPSALLADLQAIDRAMQHMGDTLNEMDVVDAADEDIAAPGFAALAKLLSVAASPSPAPAKQQEPSADYPYDALFRAIGDAARREGNAVAISVKAFVETLASKGYYVAPSVEPAAPGESIGDDPTFRRMLWMVAQDWTRSDRQIALTCYIDRFMGQRGAQ